MQVVLLPGLLCDASIWAAQIAALKPYAGVAVGDFSQLGSLEEMARAALALREGPLIVIGHSMGARVALEMVVFTLYGRERKPSGRSWSISHSSKA